MRALIACATKLKCSFIEYGGLYLYSENTSSDMDKTKPIVHILLGKAKPESMNGVNYVVHNLAAEQIKLGYNVSVFGITDTPESVAFEPDFNLQLFEKKRNRLSLDELLRAQLEALTMNAILHLHSVFIPEFFVLSGLLERKRIKYVVTPHGGYSAHALKNKRFKKKLYLRLFEKRVLERSSAIHVLGRSEVEDLRLLGVNRPTFLLPNGVPADLTRYSPKTKPQRCDFLIGYCGRLSMIHKGLDILLMAFRIFLEEFGSSTSLILIGDGEDKRTLIDMCTKMGIHRHVVFTGPKWGNEKQDIISSMNVFVHTSRWDGMPISVVEAAALGCPLLVSEATNIGGFVRQYNAGLVPDNTPESVAKALMAFAKSDLDSISKNAREMVAENFVWERIARLMILEYGKILNNSHYPPRLSTWR